MVPGVLEVLVVLGGLLPQSQDLPENSRPQLTQVPQELGTLSQGPPKRRDPGSPLHPKG